MVQRKKPTPQTSQMQKPTTEATEAPETNPADVSSIDAIIAAIYDVISGLAGQKRDWDRERSLFAAGARLIPTSVRPDGTREARVLTVEEYIARVEPIFDKENFFEREAARRIEQFGQIAHVFSTYESRRAPDDAEPFQRGVNSIQLMNDGNRWRLLTIFWQAEDEKSPLAEMYLNYR
jgi:hypothetical protein